MKYSRIILLLFISIFLTSPMAKALVTDDSVSAVANDPNYRLSTKFPYLSVILGKIGLNENIIFDYRFYGPYTAYFEKNQEGVRRVFAKDRSNQKDKDSLWGLVKELFPSPQGTGLSSTVLKDPSNLGNYLNNDAVKGAQTVALFLAWAQVQRGIPVSLPLSRPETTKVKKEQNTLSILNLWSRIKDSNLEEGFLVDVSKIPPKNLTAVDKKTTVGPKILDRIAMADGKLNAPEELKILLNALEQGNQKEKNTNVLLSKDAEFNNRYRPQMQQETPKALTPHQQREALIASISAIIGESKPELVGTIRRILMAIEGAIEGEKEGIYPLYTTEQIILGYFELLYNTQDDLIDLMKAIKTYIPTAFADDEPANGILIYDGFDYGALFDYVTKIATSKYTPYKTEQPLLQNTGALVYNRNSDSLLADQRFSDCVEAALMHVLNLTFFDPKTSAFNLEPLKSDMSMDLSIKKNILEFYESFSPIDSNDGSLKHRSNWNRVVGDLNRRLSQPMSLPPILYTDVADGQYISNIKSGFINFINTLLTITNTAPDPEDSRNIYQGSPDAKMKWIVNNLEKVLKKMGATGYTYIIKPSISGDTEDFFGTIQVMVYLDRVLLFSYKIRAISGHGWIEDLKDANEIRNATRSSLQIKGDKNNAFFPLTVDPSLKNESNRSKLVLWHFLFTNNFLDDANRIQVIKNIVKKNGETNLKLSAFESDVINNILLRTSWDDRASMIGVLGQISKLRDGGEILGKAWNTLEMKNLDLSLNQLDLSVGIVIAKALKFNKTLASLSLSSSYKNGIGKEIAAALMDNTTLTFLSFKYHRLSVEEVIAMERALEKNKTLTNLDLSNNGIDSLEALILAEALKENSTLTNLSLGFNKIGVEGIKAIANALKNNKTLTKLDLSSNDITDAGAIDIAHALEHNATLTKLSLIFNKIGIEGMKAIANALKNNATLTNLNLTFNTINAEEEIGIGHALETNKALETLNLSCIIIGSEETKALIKALKTNDTLTNLNLSCNEITPSEAIDIAQALEENKTLTTLDMTDNNMTFDAIKAFAQALKVNKTLTTLNLGSNKIDTNGAQEIAQALKMNTTLLNLDLRYNNINEPELTQINQLLERNKQMAKQQGAVVNAP